MKRKKRLYRKNIGRAPMLRNKISVQETDERRKNFDNTLAEDKLKRNRKELLDSIKKGDTVILMNGKTKEVTKKTRWYIYLGENKYDRFTGSTGDLKKDIVKKVN